MVLGSDDVRAMKAFTLMAERARCGDALVEAEMTEFSEDDGMSQSNIDQLCCVVGPAIQQEDLVLIVSLPPSLPMSSLKGQPCPGRKAVRDASVSITISNEAPPEV